MENIIPFLILALLYITTGPSYTVAVWHFRVFAAARFIHTVCYLNALPRSAFVFGVIVNVSMGVQAIMHYM